MVQNDRSYPEGIDLLMRVEGWSFPQAYDALLEWLEGPVVKAPIIRPKPMSPVKKKARERDLRRWLNTVWRGAKPLDSDAGIPARVYFRSRGICNTALNTTDLRCHPHLSFQDEAGGEGRYPALIGLVRDNDGTPVSLHRTFLTRSGSKLVVDGKTVRRLTPNVSDTKGRLIRLRPPLDGVLGIAEGLETALSVTAATGIPVWSCISASMMPSVQPPSGVNTVLVFADNDCSQAGQKAAYALRDALVPQGVKVVVMLPKLDRADHQSVDWADVLQQDPAGFDMVRTAFDLYRTKS